MAYLIKHNNGVQRIGNNVFNVKDKSTSAIYTVDQPTPFSSPAGIALDIANDRYYVVNYNSSSVRIMQYSTNTQLALITGFSGPYGIALDVANDRYYVCNYNSNNISIVDTKIY